MEMERGFVVGSVLGSSEHPSYVVGEGPEGPGAGWAGWSILGPQAPCTWPAGHTSTSAMKAQPKA